jgi:N-acetylglucosamine-6-phosphate deacetylase
VAPELPGAPDLIRRAAESGVVVGIGHTDGTAIDVRKAVLAGARLSTHLGNGCPEYIHRHSSPIWAQLISEQLSASIICDGFHLPTEVVQAITRLKGHDRCILVTDAIAVTGLAPGTYQFGPIPIQLLPSGQVITLTTPSSMAGSTLTMNRAVEQFHALGKVPFEAAIRAASTNPAQLLGRRQAVCRGLEDGEPANLTIWREDDGRISIDAVHIRGSLKGGSSTS